MNLIISDNHCVTKCDVVLEFIRKGRNLASDKKKLYIEKAMCNFRQDLCYNDPDYDSWECNDSNDSNDYNFLIYH